MEGKLIQEYKVKHLALELAEGKLNFHFETIVYEMLKDATQPEDYIKIKERLIPMPMCASKVLLFRNIILQEESI